jgi:hypothetical protein
MESNAAYKYVGVYIALDGNMDAQITTLREKFCKINRAHAQLFLSAQNTKQGSYAKVFVPSIRYVLPTTSISKTLLNKLQSNIIITALVLN